jgi:hypothetical protein
MTRRNATAAGTSEAAAEIKPLFSVYCHPSIEVDDTIAVRKETSGHSGTKYCGKY